MLTIDKPATILRSDTRTVSIESGPELAHAFISNPENLPVWAVGFCRSIRRGAQTDGWIVTTAQGDMPIRYVVDQESGSIDFYFEPAPGAEVAAFSRVVPNARGCEYIFTQFQPVGMPDEVFDAQVRALAEELQVLRGVLHARAACRV